MNLTMFAADINPMYYGTLAFLIFSGMLASIGFWALHNLKRDKKRQIGFSAAAPETHPRSAE
jgi:hypothetical protein